MAKLDKLTPEQEHLADVVASEYIRELTSPLPMDRGAVDKWLAVAYRLFELPVPARVEIVDSPVDACRLGAELAGIKIDNTDLCGVGDGGWVAFYDFLHRIGILNDEEVADLLILRDFSKIAWDTVLLDECAIVVRRPKLLLLDEDGNLHCTVGPCIEWTNGEKEFAYHGTWVSERIITEPRSFTKEEYLAISNTEERRALGEIAGWQWVCELLGATIFDEWTDVNTGLVYVLLATSTGEKMLRKQSPALKNKTQPVYVEPVHEDLKSAQAARKWQALPNLSPAQCETDPLLEYGVEA